MTGVGANVWRRNGDKDRTLVAAKLWKVSGGIFSFRLLTSALMNQTRKKRAAESAHLF